jgi:alpha-tubulin suppressor-like RCC1 family protein
VTRLSSSLARRPSFSWRTIVHLRIGVICVALLVGISALAGAASGSASAGKFSARLTKTSFTSSQAGSVKLVCKFKKKSGSFSYLLTLKKGKKWQTVKSVKKKSYSKGAATMTVKKVFAGKAVKLGSYRLKISANGAGKTLSFKVVKATAGSKPANTSLPTISGTAKQGQTLTASRGSWSHSPTAYAYRWDRCVTSGAICADIGGATSSTYVLVLGDVGSTMRVIVTAKNAHGLTSATSSKTAVVTGLPPANTAFPVISGTAKDGQTLTASNGSWTGASTYAYQWRRCNGSGANCSNISGATSSSYGLVSADVDSTIRVTVTASNSNGSASAGSRQTAAVSALITGVSSGATHTCALLSGGKVECWGMNNYGQLGNGTTTDSPTPVLVSGITSATQVSAGTSHSCALLSDHTVKCWGDDRYGELGNGTSGIGVFSSTPVTVLGVGGAGTLSNVTQVSVGDAHACALLSDSTLACWGYDGSGELGDGTYGDSNSLRTAPVLVRVSITPGAAAFTTVAQVSAGNSFTCAVSSTDGGVWCWGSDTDGKLGNNGTNDSPVPTRVVKTGGSPAVTGASQVSAREDHACAVVGGAVWCWGDNLNGELGNNDPTHTNSSVAVQVKAVGGTSTLSGATQISAGKDHNCALISSGGIDCWGAGYDGQLGNNSFNSSDFPVQVNGISSAAGLSAGLTHTCALLSDHSVECWGDNFGDQLGIGKLGHSAVPVSVSGISDASAVSSGFDHACAIRSGGTVWCWGRNYNGQLGNNSTTDSSTPVQVKGAGGTGLLTGVSQISVGGSHTCALKLDDASDPGSGGKVWCWGSDGNGELGNGYTTDSSTPAQVVIGPLPGTAALDHVIQISAGGSHTCALSQGETVSCWGRNYEGQLGNGALIHTLGSDKSTPVSVVSLTNVINISAGYGHTCAVLSTGSYTISCWGANSYGQLGHGNTTDSSSPVQVYTIGTTALTGASKVSAGSFHTCALLSSGNARCWGHNADGQLGNGTATANNPFAGQVNASGSTALTGVSNVSAGSDHSCALLSTNTVDCWGYNYSGQLGIGTLADSYYPAPVSSLTNVVQLSAGGVGNNGFSCALISGGAVKCWGSDYDGELGDGGIGLSLIPVAVVGLP